MFRGLIVGDGTRSAKGTFVAGSNGAEFPLVRVRERLRQGVTLAGAAAEVTRAERGPLAPLLAAARSHADLVAAPAAARVCRGVPGVLMSVVEAA